MHPDKGDAIPPETNEANKDAPEVIEICRRIYAETRDFYQRHEGQLGSAACGFRILYGPPIVEAPLLFLGLQPGGKAKDMCPQHHEVWPSECEYAVRCWKLAQRMRQIWSVDFLRTCTGLNVNFFRAPNDRTWRALPKSLRYEIEEFGMSNAKEIIQILKPQRIVVIGIGAFDRLTDGEKALVDEKKVLIKRGTFWSTPTYGVMHLSGARLSKKDIISIREYFSVLAQGSVAEGAVPA